MGRTNEQYAKEIAECTDAYEVNVLVSQWIKERRSAKGSQRKVARSLGFAACYFEDLESGLGVPGLSRAKEIDEYLDFGGFLSAAISRVFLLRKLKLRDSSEPTLEELEKLIIERYPTMPKDDRCDEEKCEPEPYQIPIIRVGVAGRLAVRCAGGRSGRTW